jgi:hypothetical protein
VGAVFEEQPLPVDERAEHRRIVAGDPAPEDQVVAAGDDRDGIEL